MGMTEPTRQSDEILPPIRGSTVNLAISNTAVVADLTSWPQTLALPATTVKGSEHTNPLGQYVSFFVVGPVPIFVMTTDTFAHAGTASASQTTAVDGSTGALTVNGAETVPLYPGGPYHFRLPPGAGSTLSGTAGAWGASSSARYLGAITAAASSTSFLVGWVSSR